MPDSKKAWTPAALYVALTAAVFAMSSAAPPALAGKMVLAYAACLVVGPGIVYVVLRARGARTGAAVAGALLVPLLWLANECFAIGRVFRLREAAYYAVNPLALGLFTAAALQMAVGEILLRRVREHRWRFTGGAGAVLLGVSALAAAYGVVALRHDASFIFWLYISIYRDFVAG